MYLSAERKSKNEIQNGMRGAT